jgi:CRISPR-associated endonuclease Csy4
MTTHYVDLTVVPDSETGVPTLLGALYDKLHRALVHQRLDGIGVSFPQYSVIPRSLGTMLRLHGNEAALRALLAGDWMGGMRDHVRSSGAIPVPEGVSHRVVRRRQFKTNPGRLRRRRMQRKGETADQASRAIPDSAADTPNLPYVHLRSLSTGQSFCLFIAIGPLQKEPVSGRFNAYGLGQDCTIPWF